MTDTLVELARLGWEAMARGDLDLIESLLDPDVRWHGGDPTARGTCQNRAQTLRWMRERGARPLPELVDVQRAGDKVVLVLEPPSGQGEDPADGARGRSLTANVTTVRDGKIVEMVHYDRAEDALSAVGLRS
ncbi:MAG TPA: nuclear transport factor 2 family protein [Acidimicrobiales bacterium]|jgi:ketosteroid isomerase-like protein|nr:nuclear transport factor 2 family protein [Acidimicrobiales bacterium]